MLALVTEPAVPHSTRVADVPEPTGDGVLLRVLEVGVCGTDREISEGLFGVPADGSALVLGIDGRPQAVSIEGPVLGLDAVLENRVLFGSVNAHRQDWLAAVESLDAARKRWPEQLEAFVGRRVPLDRFADAFAYRGVKATLVLDDDA
jgi:hypothetical protein